MILKNTTINSNWILLSPILTVLICHLVARLLLPILGNWTFIPVMLSMWIVAILFLWLGREKKLINDDWLKKVNGKIGWKALAIFIGFAPLPVFLMHWDLLLSASVLIPYLFIAIVNPFIEEFYWRGLIIDHATRFPKWVIVIYTSFFFALYHPTSYGLFSDLNSGWTVFTSTFVMGVIWAVSYIKIGSLRYAVIAHILVDVFNLSVPAFLELFEASF